MANIQRLTEYEVSLVFRRAAELDATTTDGVSGELDETALVQAAEEAGLSAIAVRQALAELRLGTLRAPQPARRWRPARPSTRGIARIERTVRAPKAEVDRSIAQFLVGERFVVRRRPPDQTIWEHDTGKRKPRSKLRWVDAVAVTVVEQSPDSCLVRVDLDLRGRNSNLVSGTATGVAFGAGGPAILLAGVGVEAWALLTVPLGAMMAIGIWRSEKAKYDSIRTRATDAVELLLDELDSKRSR